jgi:hypothetical protein|tara:strand:- start:1087 stop:1410 length:324 start_codon:yes stop_codon:yes gene_type:complete
MADTISLDNHPELRFRTEEEFLQHIIKTARALDWDLIYHTRRSDKSTPGYPDLHMIRDRRSVFVEVKKIGGQLSAEQYEWLEALPYTGAEAYLWDPGDFGIIGEVLA